MNRDEIIRVIAERAGLREEELSDIKVAAQLADDPLVLGLLITLLIEERKRTNELLEKILRELRSHRSEEVEDLSETDEKILELVREKGMVTAEDVREALGYRGLNGASARLNALYKRGILRKIRKGKKVYFALA